MPSVNFRMTEAERADLARMAQENGRSLQREIWHRVFRDARVTAAPTRIVDEPAGRPPPIPALTAPRGGVQFRGPDLKPSKRK